MQDFIDKYGKPSKELYKSSNQPFFTKNYSNGDYEKTDISKILEKYNLPIKLKKIYELISNPNIEYYLGDWTLISLNSLEEFFKIKKENGQERVIDFAHFYFGMGHCLVVSVDPEDSKIFYRRDGGSNGYERVEKFNKIIKYIPDDKDKYDFNYWIDKIVDFEMPKIIN